MRTQVKRTRPSERLTLKDRLSGLKFEEACKLLGAEGKQLILQGANRWEVNIAEDVYLGDDLFRLSFPGASAGNGSAPTIVTITLMADARERMHWNCTSCQTACLHVGAAFSLILEDKLALGLAAPPKVRVPVVSLNEEDLVARALAEREERARTEKMDVRSAEAAKPWTDYTVTSKLSGKSYRVSLRGFTAGQSYCSCPDFRTNTLGTCKHVMLVIKKVKRKFSPAELKKPYRRKRLALHLRYDGEASLRLLVPDKLDEETSRIVAPLRDRPLEDMHDVLRRVARLEKLGHEVGVYPDAEEFIQHRLFQDRMRERMVEIRRDPAAHPLRETLLKIPLLPYQLDGIAFAAGTGRAILADDMGLGKTIQAVGTAELLAREAEIKKVLVVCPASLKSQWRAEIHRFCDKQVQLIGGASAERLAQYDNECFFTVCNYEQVLRDILAIEQVKWDLIILDEGQRIKNWEAKTSTVIKGLKSPFALVLSGTPLENRLDELYSVVQFVDDRRLGPGFRFFNKHRQADDKGKVLGYKNLADLRERRAAGWQRAAAAAAGAGAAIPDRSRVPPVSGHQRRLHGLEPAIGQHRDQCRSALEPGCFGAARGPRASHGSEAERAGVRVGDGGHDRRELAANTGRQEGVVRGRAGCGVRRRCGRSGQRHGRTQEPSGVAAGRPTGGIG